ncbi:MAG: hypothetical protein ABL995_17325 [Bryobacteraceae bacterium]
MSLSCKDYYKKLYDACGQVLAGSLAADENGLHAVSHSFIADLERWHAQLNKRPEIPLLNSAISEYQFGLLAVVQGQYRQAFMALRLSFELLLGTAYFSANELQLRQWLRGERDLVWSALIDDESGVLSKQFVRTFYEDLTGECPHYRAMGKEVYRECSEYVHGNFLTHVALGGKVEFQQPIFDAWHAKAKTIRLVSSFALCARYINLADAKTHAELETVLLDNLGHIPAVRSILGAPVEKTLAPAAKSAVTPVEKAGTAAEKTNV